MNRVDRAELELKLKKELKKVKKSKQRYIGLFLSTLMILRSVLTYFYKVNILDYAVLDNIKIKQNKKGVIFYFDVVKSGRIDFSYGETAILSDKFDVEKNKTFGWYWPVYGEIPISIRSQENFLPHWTTRYFDFEK